MPVIHQNEIEETLWLNIYTNQLAKADYPIGSDTARAQITVCTQFADDAILTFRLRAGVHNDK